MQNFIDIEEPILIGHNAKYYDQYILKAVLNGYTPEEINIQNLSNEIKNSLKSDLMYMIEDNFAAKSLSFDTCDIDITNDGILKIYIKQNLNVMLNHIG